MRRSSPGGGDRYRGGDLAAPLAQSGLSHTALVVRLRQLRATQVQLARS
jgi:hypothetical protein